MAPVFGDDEGLRLNLMFFRLQRWSREPVTVHESGDNYQPGARERPSDPMSVHRR